MIKAIVFDCFGVLLGKSIWDMYSLAGGDPIKDAQFIEDLLAANNAGFITKSEFCQQMADRLGISVAAYTELARKAEAPNEELFAYIASQLKPHYKIGMLSNANRGLAAERFTPEQRAVFDVTAVSAETGYLKPDPRAFEHIADALGVTFPEMVFIDDLERYVLPAKALGIPSIRYTGFRELEQELATLLAVPSSATQGSEQK